MEILIKVEIQASALIPKAWLNEHSQSEHTDTLVYTQVNNTQ